MTAPLTRYLNPWRFKREERDRRIAELRERDGDACRRCRRPMRFDLPDGHDDRARIEQVVAATSGGLTAIDNQCLCHGRCHSGGKDHTAEIQERRRRENEAKLLSRKRKPRAAARATEAAPATAGPATVGAAAAAGSANPSLTCGA